MAAVVLELCSFDQASAVKSGPSTMFTDENSTDTDEKSLDFYVMGTKHCCLQKHQALLLLDEHLSALM